MKERAAVLTAISLFVLLTMPLHCSSEYKLNFDKEKAYEHILAQKEMGVRHYGSPGYEELRIYIKKLIKNSGLKAYSHNFKSPFFPEREGQNIYTIIPDAKGSTNPPYIVFASHYDSRLIAEKDPDEDRRDEPILGANDGGSSTAVLLELISALNGRELKHPVAAVFFDMEDDGSFYRSLTNTDWIQGSIAFVNDDVIPINDIKFGVLIDMVGYKYAQFKFEAVAYKLYPKLYKHVWRCARVLGYGEYFPMDFFGGIVDDHIPFALKGAPFIDIIDMGYEHHHTHEDSWDKIDKGMLEVSGSLLELLALYKYDY